MKWTGKHQTADRHTGIPTRGLWHQKLTFGTPPPPAVDISTHVKAELEATGPEGLIKIPFQLNTSKCGVTRKLRHVREFSVTIRQSVSQSVGH